MFIYFNQVKSQNRKIYISENKLEYIYLLENNTFGYQEYLNDSPHLTKQKKIFVLNSSGTGRYDFTKDSIVLTFVEQKTVIDSIKIDSNSDYSKNDSISLKFNNIFNYKKAGMPEIIIRDSSGNLIYGIYEYNNNLRKHISEFPLELIINDEEKIILETAKDYEINIFVNCFRNHNVIFDKPKFFVLNKLTLVEE